jgi:septum site-determining protein MinD
MYTGLDVLNKTCRLEQAIIKDKRQDKLAFLRLSSNRAEVPITSEQIETLVGLVKSDYEYLLIDSPAGIDNGFQTAI